MVRLSAPAIANVPGKRKAMQPIVATRLRASETRIARQMSPRRQHGQMRIVRPGREGIRNLEQSMARPRGLLRQTTAATAQALPIAGGRMSRRSALAETRRITATAALRSRVRMSRRSVLAETRRITATAALRSRVLTIRRPRPRTRRHELIPHRAAAIRRLHVPTPRPVAEVAIAEAEAVEAAVEAEARTAAVVAAAVAEAHTAVEAPALTVDTNLFARHKRPAR